MKHFSLFPFSSTPNFFFPVPCSPEAGVSFYFSLHCCHCLLFFIASVSVAAVVAHHRLQTEQYSKSTNQPAVWPENLKTNSSPTTQRGFCAVERVLTGIGNGPCLCSSDK